MRIGDQSHENTHFQGYNSLSFFLALKMSSFKLASKIPYMVKI
ncbi:hypothetical protein PMAG_b0266 [Pseudoalteromonas mariniglutinosa NCIMB 1770]|nr:hypothetical protein [Pseudoalteromonas mariniglutinosa NCIMB 1770]